jgi:glycosyltransferase involved in cell wall biosynthesis
LWHVRDHIDPSYLPAPVVKLFRQGARKLPQFVVCNSDSSLEKLFGKQIPQNARAVYDGLAAYELVSPCPPPRTTWKNEIPTVGIVGRLVEWKGQHVFLEAARKLSEQGVKARYLVIGAALFGENEYADKLKQIAAPLGDSVEFLGFRSDVPELLRSLDVFVHASVTPEPFGQVVVEAMAEGVPVLASDGGGVREIVRHNQNGLLSPMGDANALARELAGLLSDPARASHLARAGWKTVRAEFTAERTARGLESVYDTLGVR